MMNIVCMDIDDCMYDYRIESKCERDGKFMDNLMRLTDLIKRVDGEVFITSTWSKLFTYVGGYVELNIKIVKEMKNDDLDPIIDVLCMMKAYLDGRWYGISKGNRTKDIITLLDAGNVVVAIDDYDLSDIKHENYLYVGVYGDLKFNDISKIERFFRERDEK